MPLIVVPDVGAQSYCSVATADTYHSERGNADWALLTVEVKEQTLRRATDYMAAYTAQWKGTRSQYNQPLDWPRWGVSVHGYLLTDTTTVPLAVQHACALLALKASGEELAPDLDAPVSSESVGSISVSYAPGGRQTKKFAAVDTMLAPYLNGAGSSIRMTRA